MELPTLLQFFALGAVTRRLLADHMKGGGVVLVGVTVGCMPIVLPLRRDNVTVNAASSARSLMLRMLMPLAVGLGLRGWRQPASVAALLAGGSRSESGPTAPARGLFLVDVDYDL